MHIGRFAQESAIAAALALMSGYAGSALAQSDCERLRQAIAESSPSANVAQYQAAAQRQQDEIERMSAYARSIGCENHRFLFFGSEPPPQCGQINQQLGRMRANLEDIRSHMGGGGRADLIARYNSECAGQPGPGRSANVFDSLFGGAKNSSDVQTAPLTPDGTVAGPSTEAHAGSQAVCVRTCDGSFFPVSYAANSERYDSLENMCRALCPNAEVALYTFPFGSDIEQAVSPTGQRYVDSPNALKYRTTLDPNCTCRRKGQSWYEALAGAEARLGPENKGDIIVTEKKSEELSRAKPEAKADPKAKTPKGAKSPSPPTPASTTDINGVDTALSAQTQTVSREGSGIAKGADANSATIGKDQGSTVEEVGPDGVKRPVRIIGPTLDHAQ
jgi:hypothetical protein